MASITARDGRYRVRVRQHGYPPVTKTFSTKALAVAWAKRTEVDMEAGRWVDPATLKIVPTLAEAITDYQATVGAKLKGAQDYAFRFAVMCRERFASKRIDKVTPFDLSTWRDELAKTRVASTVVRTLALLSSVFTWAMKERGWIDENPMSKVRRPRVGDGRARTFSALEWDYLMQAARTSKARWLAPALTLLVESALRRGELFALRRCDVDYARCVALLHETKAGGSREAPLSPAALAALRELDVLASTKPDAPLLPVGDAGSVSTRFVVTVRRAVELYRADCLARGEAPDPSVLAGVRLHDVRHQAATKAAMTGAYSLPELMSLTGHRTTKMLVRYVNLRPQDVALKMASIAAAGAAVEAAKATTTAATVQGVAA